VPAGYGADKTTELETWLWIGNGERPTVTVVEHMLRWRWPEITEDAWSQQHQPWWLYTLNRRPITPCPLGDVWPQQGHLGYDRCVHTGWYLWQRELN
jgi:hypothetical protein